MPVSTETTSRISVVIPVYNNPAMLSRALTSVLWQSFTNFEILIVDDGSTQRIADTLPSHLIDAQIRIIRHDSNKGAAAARNTGIAHSTGNYIAFLDSDDSWHPEKLNRQLDFMQSHSPPYPMSCTGYRRFSPFHLESEVRLAEAEVALRDVLWGCNISPGSTMVAEASLFREIGSFDESLRRLEDLDWLLRYTQVTPIAVIQDVLATIGSTSRELYPLEDVVSAASIMRTYTMAGRYSLTRSQERVLLSTLNTEVAAAAFRRKHYGEALLSILKALYLKPTRSVGYARIFRALKNDLMQWRQPQRGTRP